MFAGKLCGKEKMQRGKNWSREELLTAFNYYCRTPFGRLHRNNPEIIRLAKLFGRTPSAVAMKLCNFASFDPSHKKRNVKGLSHAGLGEKAIWEEFKKCPDKLALESQEAIIDLASDFAIQLPKADEVEAAADPTEKEALCKLRTVQAFFRETVLASYQYVCAVCGLAICEMLNASHVIPWSVSTERRADPTNGIALCAFHDRAFDRGLISVDEQMNVIVAPRLIVSNPPKLHEVGLIEVNHRHLIMPERFFPDPNALKFHRKQIFDRQ